MMVVDHINRPQHSWESRGNFGNENVRNENSIEGQPKIYNLNCTILKHQISKNIQDINKHHKKKVILTIL